MDNSLFVESKTEEKRFILTKYLKYNYRNKELDLDYIQDLFNIYNLDNKIKNVKLLETVFIHSSYCNIIENNNEIENNEINIEQIKLDIESNKLVELKLSNQSNVKLDWLGDSLIGYIISLYLINRYPIEDEGFLSKLRSSLIKSNNLAYIVKYLKLNNYLIISNHMESLHNRNNNNILQIILKSFISYIDSEYKI